MHFTTGQVASMFAAYFVFSAVVSGMPAPTPVDGKGYKWAFATLHILSGSVGRLITMLPNGTTIATLQGEIKDQASPIGKE